MKVQEIIDQLKTYRSQEKKIFVSSSFQTHSIPLLHIISTSKVEIDVLFLNTGFHFPETMKFREDISKMLNLNTIDVNPLISKFQQKDAEGQFYFVSDPDYCCYLNKTQPLEPYLIEYDIWISGVRGDQSEVRKKMQIEQPSSFNTLRFHPMLDWSMRDIYNYRMEHNLPEHPLDQFGYQSIGCVPCTQKYDLMNERSARWFGMQKTECGLHTELIKQ